MFPFRKKEKIVDVVKEIPLEVIDNTDNIKKLWNKITRNEDPFHIIGDDNIVCYSSSENKIEVTFKNDGMLNIEVLIVNGDVSRVDVKNKNSIFEYSYKITTDYAKQMVDFIKPIVVIKSDNKKRNFLINLINENV